MLYNVTMTREAKAQHLDFVVEDRRLIGDVIAARLQNRPTLVSNAIKALRPSPFASYELRLGNFRVLYSVDEDNLEVMIVTVGEKGGSQLIVGGEEFYGHKSDSAERPPS